MTAFYHRPSLTARSPRKVEIKTSDGARLSAPDGNWTVDLAALCGFEVIVDTARPADDATTTYDRSVELVDDVPTVVWTARAKTQAELDREQDQAERSGREVTLTQAISWCRDRSAEAAAHTVTTANHLATTQSIVDNLATFYSGFADLLQNRQ